MFKSLPVFELAMSKATFLNDLCTAEENKLTVSDSKSGNIYLINLSDKTIQFSGSIPGANGVTYNSTTEQLFACRIGYNGMVKENCI